MQFARIQSEHAGDARESTNEWKANVNPRRPLALLDDELLLFNAAAHDGSVRIDVRYEFQGCRTAIPAQCVERSFHVQQRAAAIYRHAEDAATGNIAGLLQRIV